MKTKAAVLALFMIFIIPVCVLIFPLHTEAADITKQLEITANTESNIDKTRDGSTYTREGFAPEEKLTLKASEEISGIYIVWQKPYGGWTLTSGGTTQNCGTEGFLHEYIAVENPSSEITLTLPDKNTEICELYAFTQGELPDWVQVWSPPCEKADLMLLSTHSDDEQLFFLGVLPTYAGEKGLKVQVVYLTNHWDTESRPHEQLNGLWTVGVHNYPIIGSFPDDPDTLSQDGEAVSETLARSLDIFGKEKLIVFQKEMLERFEPQVVIAHDIEGEYHHGAHMANTWSLQQALERSSWSVPKVYIHLWQENEIIMDWDQPLQAFSGKTAYEVSKAGYACHESQQWTWFTKWIQGAGIQKASDIKKYSPCRYGLYRTTVGQDEQKNDFMEHITPYTDPTPEPIATPNASPQETQMTAPPETHENNDAKGKIPTPLIAATILLTAVFVILVFCLKKK